MKKKRTKAKLTAAMVRKAVAALERAERKRPQGDYFMEIKNWPLFRSLYEAGKMRLNPEGYWEYVG